MKEVTRIHLAKTAYDVEVLAKKQLEKYIHSLERYTQDADVLADVEIRMTELLAERGVPAGGVIGSEDVEALRTQLGEPYEFADGESDIALGSDDEPAGRRLYRSGDDAILGGVLSGAAAYFKVNPLWVRLAFVVVLFPSFGFALVIYILFWALTPLARTATEKLQLAGKEVTVESIQRINALEEKAPTNQVARLVQSALSIGLGSLSALAAVAAFTAAAWMSIAALVGNYAILDLTNGFNGLGIDNAWLVWFLFWVVIAGIMLLGGLFALSAYAFFAKKLTKKMIISAVVIIVLGIASFATVVGVGSTQSMRVANESRSMARETKANLPREFATITELAIVTKQTSKQGDPLYFGANPAIRYVVDGGPARYELSGLPTTKTSVTMNGAAATLSLEVESSFRNSFVQPVLTIYGPALTTLVANSPTNGAQLAYDGVGQESLTVLSGAHRAITIAGSYEIVTIKGSGSVDLTVSSIFTLDVQSDQNLSVNAGTVRELRVTQPEVCPSDTYGDNTSIEVANITSGTMLYNNKELPATSHRTSCAVVVVQSTEDIQEVE